MFQIEPLPLKNVRTLIFRHVSFNEEGLRPDSDDIANFIKKQVNEMLFEAEKRYQEDGIPAIMRPPLI